MAGTSPPDDEERSLQPLLPSTWYNCPNVGRLLLCSVCSQSCPICFLASRHPEALYRARCVCFCKSFFSRLRQHTRAFYCCVALSSSSCSGAFPLRRVRKLGNAAAPSEDRAAVFPLACPSGNLGIAAATSEDPARAFPGLHCLLVPVLPFLPF